ncbi:MOR1A protein, partial [Xiphorhynchus elegans]|nr:MOR1A protein [Xiphorhynchus elegans]
MGDNAVLDCPDKPNATLVTWKISPKVGSYCTLGYRADMNETNRTSCSDSMNWKLRPDVDPTLEIRQVGIAQEGNYTCEVVTGEGNFHKMYHLTVLGKGFSLHLQFSKGPYLGLDIQSSSPSAPQEISSPLEEQGHISGTVTVLSRFTACSTNVTSTTCMVFHPAGNWSESIDC